MRILCWNVNGLRAIKGKGFFEWIERADPDILCLQETKIQEDQLDPAMISPKPYQAYYSSAQKKGYSGVSVFTKLTPNNVKKELGVEELDQEGRLLTLDYGHFILVNGYFPNGGSQNKRVPFKMEYYDHFFRYLIKMKKKNENIVVCGDVNTAHAQIDLARPKENEKNTGFLPEERMWITQLLDSGWIDTFRHFEKSTGHYTWWDYKTRARERNVGWRIDYFFITKKLLPKLDKAFILKDVQGSDHCPVGIDVDL